MSLTRTNVTCAVAAAGCAGARAVPVSCAFARSLSRASRACFAARSAASADVEVTALSVAMAWLYWRTNGSLLLTMLLHAAVNNTKDIVPSAVPGATDPSALSTSLVGWLTVAFLWIAAAYFLARGGGVYSLDYLVFG